MQIEDAQATAPTLASAEPSSRTDRLELLQQLSGGSTGLVHKARNPKLNRTVALRQLQVPEWLDDADDLIKRILSEARAASALDHPNIARLYTGGYKGFTVFLTSEFVEGTNIREFVASRNLALPEIIALGKQLCSALDYAHQKKVFHNGLTPANIKVLPDGNLKVLDFGVMRDKNLYSPTPAKRLENEHYLSPEQIKGKPVTQATNVFAAATILYELLTTRNPFAGKHLGEVDRNITEIDPPPASLAHARVSENISKALMKALAKQPLARFQSCADFSAALEEALKASVAKTAPSASASAAIASQSVAVRPAAPAPAPKLTSTSQSAPVKSAVEIPAAAAKASVPQPPPKAPVQVRKDAPVMPPPSKMPAKMLAQWKLVGGIVAALFVVSAVAISFNHRSKVSVPLPEATASAPALAEANSQPSVAAPDIAETTAEAASAIDIQDPHSKARKQRMPSGPAPAAATDGQLLVSSDPAGATISIDGRTMDSWKTPQTVASLAPAVYKVTVSKPGYSTETRSVQVVGGNRALLDVKLTALKATLSVGGTPLGARIVIDGKETGKFSPAEFTLDPAVHTITLHREGFFDSSGEVKLVAGQSLNYSPNMTSAGRTDNIRVVGGFKKLFGGGSSAGMARLEIRSDPKGAQISINGTVLSKTTPVEIQLEPGNYEITLQKDGYKPIHKSVTTQFNDKLKIDEQLSR